MHVEFHPAALAESEEAQTWYAERSLIAAASFLRELSVAVQRAAEAPRRYPSGPAATRRVVLDRYPFTVFYRPSDDGIMVVAVASPASASQLLEEPLTSNRYADVMLA